MDDRPANEITDWLQAWQSGDATALDRLLPLVYGELRRLAGAYMRGERDGHLLQTTALVNEAYLRLLDWRNIEWEDRQHFYAIAAQMMRRVLVDFARARRYAKRGGNAQQVSFNETAIAGRDRHADLIALDDALNSLAEASPRQAMTVELRYFGGFSVEETADVLDVSTRTVIREWNLARAWLYRELRGEA
ncbi:MAG: sigma-70 family RNA polymerase sigma factor [Acidobacteriota bacterium]|nr:sigma-70 family RNA polymerase sigma factor [Acidobacteriota bacterium]